MLTTGASKTVHIQNKLFLQLKAIKTQFEQNRNHIKNESEYNYKYCNTRVHLK
jgi:hypothetical protein